MSIMVNKLSFKTIAPFTLLGIVAFAALFVPTIPDFADSKGHSNTADIAWILVATALVFLKTPGLACFYGGMVHRKHVLPTKIKSVVAAGIVSILWMVVGYSLAFGQSIGGFIGNPSTHFFFKNVASGAPWAGAPSIPLTLFALFQLMFAIITPGLVVGAVAERIRFTAYILFIALFSLMVYAPIAHWTWHPDGFLAKMGVLDFAGGTAVHISAGCAALAGALVNAALFFTQMKAMLIVLAYSFIMSFAIFKFINFILPLRVSLAEEEVGLDKSQHDEKYVQGTLIVEKIEETEPGLITQKEIIMHAS
jgi:Amt family ammonium transporter